MTEAKLTKKQRKALEFRTKAGKGDAKTNEEEVKDASVMEVDEQQEHAEEEKLNDLKGKQKEDDTVAENDSKPIKSKKKEVKKADSTSQEDSKPSKTTSTRKRKQTEDAETSSEVKATKKRFDEDGNVVESTQQDSKVEKDTKVASTSNDSKRYIVFVGNMSYKTTTEEITKHFADHCGEKPSVRLLTTKGDPSKAKELSKSKQKSIAKGKALDPGAPQSKGCAFVEFKQRDAMQKALQFHHTKLQGRSINVELTAGGGGKGAERKEKIAKKNKGLEEERRKLHEKYVKDTNKKSGGEKEGQPETKKEEEPRRPQWGPNAAANGKPKQATKIPRWAATGANATKLQT